MAAILVPSVTPSARIDEEEDLLYRDRRSDELPEHLTDKERRVEWIRRELGKIKDGKETSRGRGPAQINATDPDCRLLKTKGGCMQGYNAQAVVDRNQVIVAAELTNGAADAPHLEPMVGAAVGNLEAAGADAVGTLLADAGYLSLDNVNLDVDCDLLIAPARSSRIAEIELPKDLKERRAAYEAALEIERTTDRRVEALDDLIAEKLTLREAAERLDLSITGVWHMKKRYLVGGRDAVRPWAPPPPEGPSAKQIMAMKLSTKEAKKRYALRSVIVEPVFSHIKWVRGVTRFMRHGLPACAVEWKLEATVHNLLKLWRSGWSPARAPKLAPKLAC